VLAALLLAASAWAGAQDLDSDAVLENLRVNAETLQDASFLLTGRIVDPDGTDIPLEIEVQYIPSDQAASAYILQPDALADNIIVLDGQTVANYTFLTHQITLFDATDPDAFGGLLGAPEGEAFEFTTDLGQLFAGFESAIEGYGEGPAGNVYVLAFTNVDEAAAIARVEADVVDGEWYPYSLRFLRDDASLLAELFLEGFAADQGLAVEDVVYLPEDAEVIDERE
jgi:hypothetical protein